MSLNDPVTKEELQMMHDALAMATVQVGNAADAVALLMKLRDLIEA